MKLDQVLSGHGLGGGKYRVGSQIPFDYFGLDQPPSTTFLDAPSSAYYATGICRDDVGSLYILNGNVLNKYDAADKTVVASITDTNGTTYENTYTGLVFAGGNLWFTDWNSTQGTSRINRTDKNLTSVTMISVGGDYSYGLCASPDGRYVYIAGRLNVRKYDGSTGALIWTRANASTYWWAYRIACDNTGHYYVYKSYNPGSYTNNYIAKYNDSDGTQIWQSPTMDSTSMYSQVTLAVADENTIYGKGTRYDSTGAQLWSVAPNTYAALALTPAQDDGVLFFDSGNNRLLSYTTAGVERWRSAKAQPDPAGNVIPMYLDSKTWILWMGFRSIKQWYLKFIVKK